jgi:hypothetical protein
MMTDEKKSQIGKKNFCRTTEVTDIKIKISTNNTCSPSFGCRLQEKNIG